MPLYYPSCHCATTLSITILSIPLYYQSSHCATILSIQPLYHYIINPAIVPPFLSRRPLCHHLNTPAIVPLYYQTGHCATTLSSKPLCHYIINPAIVPPSYHAFYHLAIILTITIMAIQSCYRRHLTIANAATWYWINEPLPPKTTDASNWTACSETQPGLIQGIILVWSDCSNSPELSLWSLTT